MSTARADDPILAVLPSDTERQRYRSLLATLTAWGHLFQGQHALDVGCSWGTSAVALLTAGAAAVDGVEPSVERVAKGLHLLYELAVMDRIALRHTPDTTRLPFESETFFAILANGVIEHIPQVARPAVLREIWRVLAPGGHLMIAETPNPYYPKDQHTTQLWLNHWLPERLAHRRAVWAGAFRAERTDWVSSGWRGAGYYGLARYLTGATLIPEPITRTRQRVLAALGLPPMLLDPWPTWVFRKPTGGGLST